MGDRAYCTLYLKEAPSEELIALLEETLDIPCEGGDRHFCYEEVNWAQLPAEVKAYCAEHKIQLAWINGDRGSYGPGVYLFDGEKGIDWPIYDNDLVLTVPQLKDQDTVDLAIYWQGVLDGIA